jgi:serine/threonine-protein kinase RsbT
VQLEQRIEIHSDRDVVSARQVGRDMASQLGFSPTDLTLIATAVSEIARNITTYAGSGEIVFRVGHEDGREVLEVVARDEGPGIDDLRLAMQDGYTSGTGMGLGLPGSKRLMDEFEVDSSPAKGTTVTMKKWAPDRA